MPPSSLSTFFGNIYNVSPTTHDDEDVEAYNQPAPDEDSSGEESSGESYSAGGAPNKNGAEGSESEESQTKESDSGRRSSSSTGDQPQHTTSSQPQAKHRPSSRPSPVSTLKKGTGVTKGTGPVHLPGPSRRPRNAGTYNLKTLSRQAVGYPEPSPKKRHAQILVAGSRRQPEPPTYNLKELVQRTRGRPIGTKKLFSNLAKRPAKGITSVSGQKTRHVRQLPVNDDDENHGTPPKRQRFNPDDSIADSFASEGLDVTDSTLQKANPASISTAHRPRTDGVVSSKPQEESALLQYIKPWVQQGGIVLDSNGITDVERITKMPALPMQRTIEWNNESRCRWIVNTKIDIVALMMQVTGEDPPSPCNRCRSDPQHGQWVGCKVMSSNMVGEAWRLYGCANCVYHGRQTYCNLKIWNRKRAQVGKVSERSPKEKSGDGEAEDDSSEDTDQSKAGAANITATKDNNAQIHTSGHPVYHNSNITAIHERPTRHQDASLISAGDNGDTPLRMESWEKAPGRLQSRDAETVENIAFSKSYLANGHEISQFAPQKDTIRLCSIASGKLKVDMDGEHPFTIGSHGMFRILPGSGCRVENEIYDDVTVHITSIKVEDD